MTIDKNDVRALMQMYEMQMAYVRITDMMGPSPQLSAFVNLDKMTDESIGLESFNIMDVHEQTLKDIENSPVFGLLVKAYVDGKSQFHDSSIATEGLLGKFVRGIFSNVTKYPAWVINKRIIMGVLDWHKRRVTAAPNNNDIKAWEKYENDNNAGLEKLNKEIESILDRKEINSDEDDQKTKFSKSGWNKQRYDAEQAWIANLEKSNQQFLKANEAKIKRLRDMVAKADDGDDDAAKAGRLLRRVTGDIEEMLRDINLVAERAKNELNKIGKHID